MATPSKRAALLKTVGQELGRELGARTILFHQAMADLAGISVTDIKCLDYIDRGGDVTAGDLARLTGLTTGAITAAIDRLEKGGYAIRERSEADRRKVYIRLANSPKMTRLHPIYDTLGQATAALSEKYSVRELETIQDYMLGCTKILRDLTETVVKTKRK